MRKLIGPVAAIMLAISALGAPSALAATEFGDTCAGDDTAPGDYTITTLSAPAGPLPLTAPSAGVITQVKVRIAAPIPFAIPTTVKALHSAGGSLFTVVGQTTVQASAGLSTAGARIPVQAGDRLALHGQPFTFEGSPVPSLSFYCEGTGDGSILGAALGEPGPGATAEFAAVDEGRVPLAAVLEPDADNDGFGDETQDQCPQSASTQAPCPLATLSASAVVRKGLATILITSNVQVPVTVAGKVKLGKGKKANLNGGTQVVTPGTIAKFTVLFPARLKEALRGLSRKQFLTLALTATAPNIAGAPTVKKVNAKAKGQKKPARKGKRGKGKGKGGKRG